MKPFLRILLMTMGMQAAHAQDFEVPKSSWLQTLRSSLPVAFCRAPRSPFLPVYKGKPENCIAAVEQLFDRCVNREPRIALPEKVTSVAEGDALGQRVSDCIVAYYQGGAALDAFHKKYAPSETSVQDK